MLTPMRAASVRFIAAMHLSATRGLRKKATNPGLSYQISAIEDVAEAIEKNPEGFGDLETDLLNAHKSHKQYELEKRQHAEQIRKFVVKSKYFRDPKLPNFLTYAEKEQIRLLHSRDPEQWSVEVLAESFPANSDIIRKILKANWKPKSTKSHDEKVYKNWELFREGELQLPKELENHLKKFSHRQAEESQSPNTSKELTISETQTHQNKPLSTEFSSIITFGKPRSKPESIKRNTITQKSPPHTNNESAEDETYLLDKVVDKKSMRLADLKRSKPELEQPSEKPNHINDQQQQQLVAADYKTTSTITGIAEVSPTRFAQKFTLNEIEISSEDQKRFEVSRVKNRIHIPRKLFRKGATYRVDDTYYDADGEFLYRVPGMTGRE